MMVTRLSCGAELESEMRRKICIKNAQSQNWESRTLFECTTLLATVNMLKESVFFVTSGFFSATRAPRSSRIYRHKSWPSFRCFDRSRNWNKVCLGKIKRYVLSLIFSCSWDPSFSVQTGCYCWPSKSVFFQMSKKLFGRNSVRNRFWVD